MNYMDPIKNWTTNNHNNTKQNRVQTMCRVYTVYTYIVYITV